MSDVWKLFVVIVIDSILLLNNKKIFLFCDSEDISKVNWNKEGFIIWFIVLLCEFYFILVRRVKIILIIN